MSQIVDVAIVGAGPAGAATARRLAACGCRVALVERSRFEQPRVGESLAPAVQPLLRDLGVWDAFVELRPLPSYGTRSVWGSDTAEEHSHLVTPFQQGWHVERLGFDRMLAEAARGAGAQLLLGARVQSCAVNRSRFVLRLMQADRSMSLEADFIIDATGRGGAVGVRLGAYREVFDRLVAVAAVLDDLAAGDHCYTLVETTTDGWWYSAPVDVDRSVAMLMADGDLLRAHVATDAEYWRRALQLTSFTCARMGTGPLRWGPRAFSAVSQRLIRTDGARLHWLAVGDATLSVDPISGSGVIRALRTAHAAAETVIATLSGDAGAIARYEDDRDMECTSYLTTRAGYYDIERRWAGSTFWDRRSAVVNHRSLDPWSAGSCRDLPKSAGGTDISPREG